VFTDFLHGSPNYIYYFMILWYNLNKKSDI